MHNQRKWFLKNSHTFMHIDSLIIKDEFISMVPDTPTSSEENFLKTSELSSVIAIHKSLNDIYIIIPSHIELFPEEHSELEREE